MRVIKRNNDVEDVSFDKVLNRIRLLSTDIDVDYYDIAQKVCSRIYDHVKTSELDELAANICSSLIADNPDYGILAARIIISNHHKNTSPSFSETVWMLYNNKDVPLISQTLYEIVIKNKDKLNHYIDYTRDYDFDYFGFKTLERSYLLKCDGRIVERPQHLFMRVALGIHGNDIKDALQTYDLMSKKFFTHATPTLFNAGTPKPQLSSCFLLAVDGDSIDKIFDTVKECAMISKFAGGIGIHVQDIRAKGSIIKGTNGISDGIVPMLKVLNQTARYVNQCFTPETSVYTLEGIKRMDEVTCEDSLLTNDTTYRKVHALSINNVVDAELLKIKTWYGAEDVCVTQEHDICVLRNGETSFVPAKDLVKGDYVGYSVPSYEVDDPDLSLDDCCFYGILWGCASTFVRTDGKISYTLAYFPLKLIGFIEKYLHTRGIPYLIYPDKDEYNMLKFVYKSVGLEHFDVKTKAIPSKFLHLPKQKLLYFLRGLYGSCNVDKRSPVVHFYDMSYLLTMGVRYMLLRLGIMSWGSAESRCETPYYRLSCKAHIHFQFILNGGLYSSYKDLKDLTDDNAFMVEDKNMLWTEISDIDTMKYTGPVYDFNMTDNHNYTVVNLGIVHNSGKRNGSIAVYLEPWHADVFEFLDLKKPHGSEEDRARDLFYALWIPDLFMERVKNNAKWSLMCPNKCKGLPEVYGDEFKELYESYETKGMFIKQVDAQQLWFKILEIQVESGGPYLLFKDACNKKSNQQNLGTIKSSNLCVGPETLILTDEGYFPIVELKNRSVNVWNGHEFSNTVVRKTGHNKKLLTVSFSNGMNLRCTPYHRFCIEGVRGWVEAQDLKVGMRIIKYVTPTINGKANLRSAYTQGIFATKHADYDYFGNHVIGLKGEHKKLLNHVEWTYFNESEGDQIDVILAPDSMKDKFFVPINYNISSRLQWLEGFLDGEGEYNACHESVQVYHSNMEFLRNILLLLQTLGVASNVRQNCLTLDTGGLIHLFNLGLNPRLLQCPITHFPSNFYTPHVRIVGIQDNNEFDDTYCFNEHKEHMGIFNGILTMNCSEIVEYSSPDETAVCNLASICLPTYVEAKNFNFEKLHEVVMTITKNLNKVIDITYYPVEKTRRSNLRHRPIGIGIQGLADVFVMMGYAFDSEEAKTLNRHIFETIYNAAVEQSMKIAKIRHELIQNGQGVDNKYLNMNEFDPPINSKYPGAYSSFEGSPAEKGKLQFDLWDIDYVPNRYDWTGLKNDIKKYGMRNSLLIAPMPTASTSQIMGFNEACEAFTSNIYKRKTLAGEFIIVNKYLIKDLSDLGLWNKDMKNRILLDEGSVQHIAEIPDHIKALYKTVWEIKQKVIIDQAADRGAFICQSQSMNLFVESPNYKTLSSMHFYSWSKGLKTCSYYIRSKPKGKQQQFTIEPAFKKEVESKKTVVCTDEVCTVCSS